MENNLNSSLDILFNKMEEFVSTKTVVGEAVTIGDVVLLPLIEVTVGVGAGQNGDKGNKDSGVGGLGAKIIPSAVLVINGDNVQLINIKNQDAINKLVDMVPGVVSKLNFGSLFGKKDEVKEHSEEVKFEEKIIVEE